DVVYHGDRGRLEFDFEVAPGADARAIKLLFRGARGLTASGANVALKTAGGEIDLAPPVAYQDAARGRKAVAAGYEIERGTVRIALGDYDRTRPLVIDPGLIFSTYLGGTEAEGQGVAIDASGNVYVTGWANDAC